MGSPKFFDAPLHACHVLMTPAGLQNLTMSIPLRGLLATVRDGRLHLQPPFRGCTRPQGGADSLTAYMVPCVRFRPFVRFVSRLSSSRSATLGTGGWLDLTRQGLAPCKKRQACLGAHGTAVSGGNRAVCGFRPLDRLSWAPPSHRPFDVTGSPSFPTCAAILGLIRLINPAVMPEGLSPREAATFSDHNFRPSEA